MQQASTLRRSLTRRWHACARSWGLGMGRCARAGRQVVCAGTHARVWVFVRTCVRACVGV